MDRLLLTFLISLLITLLSLLCSPSLRSAPICAAAPVVRWIHYVLLTVLSLSIAHPVLQPADFRLDANPLCVLAEATGSRMRERKSMCVWVQVCECDLYPRVEGFLIRGQGPHCSDKDGDGGLLEPVLKETLS